MTVRTVPLRHAMLPDAPITLVLFVDDSDMSVQRVGIDFDREEVVEGVYQVEPSRTAIRDAKIEQAGNLLDGLVMFGLGNTMYVYDDDDVREFDSMEPAVDYVFTEIWEK